MLFVLQYAVPGYRCVPLLQALNGYQLEEEEEEEAEEAKEEEGSSQTRDHVNSLEDSV